MKKVMPESYRIGQINSLDNVTFVRWDGVFKNNTTKAVVKCGTCDFEWSSTIGNLVTHGKRCPSCAKRRRYNESEYIDRVNDIEGITFVKWHTQFDNAHSKASYRCDNGHEWVTSLNMILHNGTRCPVCAGNAPISEKERLRQIELLSGVNFVRWVDGYSSNRSRVVLKCDNQHEWECSLYSVTRQGTRCPTCAIAGFKPEEKGSLYALLSECGSYLKIGISNKYKVRLKCLRATTPFRFDVYGVKHFNKGRDARQMEHQIHSMFPNAELDGFDGCTEWLVNSTELREYLSTILR